MGSGLSEQVNSILSDVLTVQEGRIRVGLDCSYRATKATLRPRDLDDNLVLTGSIEELRISTDLFGVVGAIFGAKPSPKVTARGVALNIGTRNEEMARGAPASKIPSQDFRQQLKKLVVELEDVDCTLNLAGHPIEVHVASLRLDPLTSTMDLSWKVTANGVAIKLDGAVLGSAENGTSTFHAGLEPFHVMEVKVGNKVHVSVDDLHLVALLEVAQTLSAILVSNAAVQGLRGKSIHTCKVDLAGGTIELRMHGDQLLLLRPGSVTVKVSPQACVVNLTPLSVACGGDAEVRSDLLVTVPIETPARPAVHHGFRDSCGQLALPWQGVVELFETDPRFEAVKFLLAWLRGEGCDIGPAKRPRDDAEDGASAASSRATRPRL